MEWEPPLRSSGIRARIAPVPGCGTAINQLLEVPSPYFHKNSPANRALARLRDDIARDRSARPLILNIGSQSKKKDGTVNLDIVQHGNADIIADATYMPF